MSWEPITVVGSPEVCETCGAYRSEGETIFRQGDTSDVFRCEDCIPIARKPKPFPHGECECSEHVCDGPAAWSIAREGKRLAVCTRCTLSDDTDRSLLVTMADPVQVYLDYDALGLLIIAAMLGEKGEMQ